MASVASLREHLIEELHDLSNAEQQLIEALPQMQQKATARELKAAFKSHLAETKEHARRIEHQILVAQGEAPPGMGTLELAQSPVLLGPVVDQSARLVPLVLVKVGDEVGDPLG